MGAVHSAQRGETFAGYSKLEVTICTCGVLFAVPAKLLGERRYDGKSFYCPHGHCLSFDGDKKKLTRDLESARARAGSLASRLEQTGASLTAQRGATTRARNDRDRDRKRVARGVCPCCTRSFKDLRRHMVAKHPEFAETPAE